MFDKRNAIVDCDVGVVIECCGCRLVSDVKVTMRLKCCG
jgi:hypothetical protein